MMDQEQETTAAPEPEDAATAAPEAEAQAEERQADGTERVEFENEKTEARFKHVWKQMREGERVNAQLAADNKALLERLEKVEEVQLKGSTDSQISDLRQQKVAALEAGDYARAAALDEAMLDLKVQAAQAKPRNGHAEPPKQERGGLSPSEMRQIEVWGQERNDDGSPKRPWSDPSHPEYRRALRVLTTIVSDEDFGAAPLDDILAETDRIMGVAKGRRPAAGAVLSTDGNAAPRRSKAPALTAEQKAVAAKMGLTAEQYTKAMQKYGAGRGIAE